MSIVSETVLTEVEEVAAKFVERFRDLKKENTHFKEKITELKQELEVLEKEFRGKCDQVKLLEKDRKKSLFRVEKVLKSLSALEEDHRQGR